MSLSARPASLGRLKIRRGFDIALAKAEGMGAGRRATFGFSLRTPYTEEPAHG